MAWLYCSGLFLQTNISALRSAELSECLNNQYSSLLFDLCYKNSNDKFTLSLFQYLTPFIPSAALVWITWLMKLDFRLSEMTYPVRTMRWLRGLGYCVGLLACVLSLSIVVEKETNQLHLVEISSLLLGPWLASAWISAPLLFQKVLGPASISEQFKAILWMLYSVIAMPIIALLLLTIRQATQS